MKKHIVFDFDGVLVDSFKFHLNKLNDLYGIKLTAEEYCDIHNGNFYANIPKKLEGIDFTDYSHFVASDQKLLPMYPDSKKILHLLSKKYSLHILTSGWERQVMPNLTHNGVTELFDSFWFADVETSKSKKLSKLIIEKGGDVSDYIFVTDTLGDIFSGNKVGMETIAVTFGFHDEGRLLRGDPYAIVHSWKELEAALSNV